MRFLKKLAFTFLVILGVLATFLYVRFGGGKTYTDITTSPIMREHELELYVFYPEPIGNVAASKDSISRVFFTVHPESRPERVKLLEVINGKAFPYPDEKAQELFNKPLGVYTDNQQRLWVIDHGNHATEKVRLWAFDLKTNQIAHEYVFPDSVAELGSFFNDLSVSPDGKFVYVADVSFWRKSPSLIVYDIENKRSRSILGNHESVSSQGYVPVTPAKKMRFILGLVDLMPGIDGLDVDSKNQYVYYATMSHEGLYRIPTNVCQNFTLSKEEIASKVEKVSQKPLSDGIRVDTVGNVYITDIEHQGITVVTPEGKTKTLLKDKKVRWADGLSFGGDGYCYLADSDIPDQMLQSKSHIEANKPYHIFRFKPPYEKIKND
jgi:sugar lactone lactonase YvrE